ncbi:MAG: DUF1275 domain-containing protein [Tetragenococcus halophilus]|nr:DUF1275 domain-containing protein [Tetragenococcus halophilus]MDN6599763.1 DUF1275 domain-containing protein [Tetragenococcus koreensis]
MNKIAKESQTKVLSYLTITATFLMGFIDAYTFLEKDGVFVSAQTGNMVSFSSKLFTGQFIEAWGHVSVFAGFALGAFLGELVIQKTKQAALKKYQVFLLIQGALLLIIAIFQNSISDALMVFLLGLISGYELTIFREIGTTTVNDGIMTGNIKSLMNNLYKTLFNKDVAAKKDLINLSLTLLIFIIGVGAGSLIVQIMPILNLWLALFITLALYMFLVRVRRYF